MIRNSSVKTGIVLFLFIISVVFTFCFSSSERVFAQDATEVILTVTSTSMGPYITVKSQEQDQINVRSGPGMSYPQIGVLLAGQTMPAKGKSAGEDWILIEYPGVTGGEAWVYSALVDLLGGKVPIVAPPSTPTPLYTPTIDPTLEARYIVTKQPTSLPTYTEPAQIIFPTLPATDEGGILSGIPFGLVIIVLLAAGFLIGIVAFVVNR